MILLSGNFQTSSAVFLRLFSLGVIEGMSDKKRADYIIDFIKLKPAMAEFMKKGIHTVGFPDMMTPAFQKAFEGAIKADQEYLHHAKKCKEKYLIIIL